MRRATLEALKGRKLAILSNGSSDILDPLVQNSGFAALLDATLSVDAVGVFKPGPKAYALVEQRLGVRPAEVAFVSSNPFDASGAKSFGFKVAWIERVTATALADEIRKGPWPDRSPCSRRRGSGPIRSASIRTGPSAVCRSCLPCWPTCNKGNENAGPGQPGPNDQGE